MSENLRSNELEEPARCPLCNKILRSTEDSILLANLRHTLPCSECFMRFRRRKSIHPRLINHRRHSDLGTITEANQQQNTPAESESKETSTNQNSLDSPLSKSLPTNSYLNNSNYFSSKVNCSYCLKPTLLSNSIDHLKYRHFAVGYESNQDYYEFINGTDHEGFDIDGLCQKPDYIRYNERYFLSEGSNSHGKFYGWITMLGPQEEAYKYQASVQVFHPISKMSLSLSTLQWKWLRIEPFGIQQTKSKSRDSSLKSCYSMRWSELKPFIQIRDDNSFQTPYLDSETEKERNMSYSCSFKYMWRTRVTICKI